MVWHMGRGLGLWLAFGWIIRLVFLAVVILAIYAFISHLNGGGHTAEAPRPGPTAREILEQRYARGEITTVQFEQMRAELDRSSSEKPAGS